MCACVYSRETKNHTWPREYNNNADNRMEVAHDNATLAVGTTHSARHNELYHIDLCRSAAVLPRDGVAVRQMRFKWKSAVNRSTSFSVAKERETTERGSVDISLLASCHCRTCRKSYLSEIYLGLVADDLTLPVMKSLNTGVSSSFIATEWKGKAHW